MVYPTELVNKSTPHHLHRPRRNPKTRVIRISVTDADATDSSSDDEECSFYSPERRRRIKRFICHVNMERRRFTTTAKTTTTNTVTTSNDAVLVSRNRRQASAGGKTTTSYSDTYDTGPKQAREEVIEPTSTISRPETDPEFDSLFSSDFVSSDLIEPSVLGLFAEPGLDQGHFGSLFFDAYSVSSSKGDFGFGFSGTTWPGDEQNVDIGDIFGSDPLVAI